MMVPMIFTVVIFAVLFALIWYSRRMYAKRVIA